MFLSYLQFHCKRLIREQPAFFAAFTCGLFSAAMAALLLFQQWQRHADARSQLNQLSRATMEAKQSARVAAVPDKSDTSLPKFDGVQLVHALNELAAETRTPIDEVAYALDSGVSDPYLRYRIKLGVSAQYPVIRDFGARFISEWPNISMDSISCTRPDTTAVPLTCEMQFSAFYQRGGRG